MCLTNGIKTKIIDRIKENKTFLIASHMNPEGDAIGSALALAISLKSIEKEVTVFNQDPTPRNLQFLPMSNEIVHRIDGPSNFDVAVVLDCADFDRLGKEGGKIEEIKNIINIDHHKTNSGFGELSLVDPYASSTAEIIYDLIKDIPVQITHDIAVNIYTGLLTDTGSFCYSNTTAEVLQIASDLVGIGVIPYKVAEEIYEKQPISRTRLLGSVLNTLEVLDNGRIAFVKVSLSMLEKAAAAPYLTENMVNYPKSIRGVKVAVLFREVSRNHYKMSFRSNEDVDVADIASEFGGGGHPRASGCSIKGSLSDVKERIFDAINRRLNNVK